MSIEKNNTAEDFESTDEKDYQDPATKVDLFFLKTRNKYYSEILENYKDYITKVLTFKEKSQSLIKK